MKGFLVCLLSLVSASVFGRDLIIAGIPEEPLRFKNSKGELEGLDLKIVDEAFKRMGVKTKVILEASSSRLDKGWQSGDYDVVYCYSKVKEREEHLWYAHESFIEIPWKYWMLKENDEKIKFENFSSFKGLRIGATKGYSYSDEFWEAGKKGDFILDEVVKNELHIKKLLQGKIDVMVDHPFRVMWEAKNGKYTDKLKALDKNLKTKAYYTTFVKKSSYPGLEELIPKYDKAILEMKKDGTIAKIYQEYGLTYENK